MQLSCCWKLASKNSAQLTFCLKLATLVKKLKRVQNIVCNCPVDWNWRENTLRNRPVAKNRRQNTLCNCRFVWNWRLCQIAKTCFNTPCATVLLFKIGVKTLCATVVLLEIGDFREEAKSCQKRRAQLSCCSKLASKQSAHLSICLNLATSVKIWKLPKTTCAPVQMLEIGVKTLCATVVLLEIGDFC